MYIGAEGYRNTPQVQVAGKQPSQPKHVGISNSSSTFKIHREKSVNMRKRICPICRFAPILLLAALFVPPAASAQETGKEAAKETPAYPIKPVRFVVPYPHGGGTDVIARIVQIRFQALLGQPVLIENRGGAAGTLGTDVVAKSAPDGYTVLFTLSSHTINPAIYSHLRYDTANDFEPVGMVASLPQILVANPQFSANTVAELTAMAKAKPGMLQFASVGNGSPSHLAGELYKLRARIDMVHVPYRGGGPAIVDLLCRHLAPMLVSISSASPLCGNRREDTELNANIGALVARARAAQAIADAYDQVRTDEMVVAAGWAIIEPGRNRELAELAVTDTGVGNVEDKVRKNHRKTFGLLRDLKGAKSVGIIRDDPSKANVQIDL